ncbi:MAG: hypothetical protein WCC63_04135 [Candidatus Bathyarchaeia archaeon]
MKESGFREYLKGRKLNGEYADFAVSAVREFEEYLEKRGTSFEAAGLDELKDYVSLQMKESRNLMERLVAIARYCSFAKKNDCYVYFTSILGAREVLPNLAERLKTIVGEETQRKIFEGFELPPLGSPQDEYPRLTRMIVERLEAELPREMCREVLTWNYHNVPVEAFREKKEHFEEADSIDEYLKEEHSDFIEELEEFMKEGRVWFEQEITPEVLDFVKGNQEICTGVRHGDKIYVTKIPYTPKRYLREIDPTLKRFYACHCPLVRTAIRDGSPKISPIFCYCSGGFEKLPFDVIFGEPVVVELLESALKGDERCRFAIKIPNGKMK